MKRIGLVVVALFLSLSVFAKETESKTFLIIFKSKELKSLNTSLKEIQSQFATSYSTRSYSGNSELSLIIHIPACDFDACFLGQILVELENNKEMKLQDIAFRMVDMTKSQASLNGYLSDLQASQAKKKNNKLDLAISGL